MATQRLLRSQPGLLTGAILDANGDPVTTAGAVTVAVTSVSGATILAAGTAATASGDVGIYQVAVTSAQTAQLDRWVATWVDTGNGSTQTTYHEICGGFFFSLSDARASDDALQDTAKFPDTLVLQKRQAVEDEAEFICDVCFVPRYRRVALDGTAEAEIYLPDNRIRVIRSVSIVPYYGGTQVITFDATQLASLNTQLAGLWTDSDFKLTRNDGGIWDEGRRNVTIEYEVGWDAPPAELVEAAKIRLRYAVTRRKSSVADRATSFVTEGGTTYKLDSADAFATGIPDVDAVYNRYSTREFDDQDPIPVSRPVDFDPSWFSVYHGGRR